MKTFLVNLESHDDVTSARDRMSWSQSTRLVLVWPERGRILRRKLDLVLLQRYSQHQGCQMALVTQDQEVLANARELGIPVFTSTQAAQRQSWRRTRRRRLISFRRQAQHQSLKEMQGARSHPGLNRPFVARLLPFTIGVLAVLILVLFFLPGATISFSLPRMDQQLSLKVGASPEITSPNLSGGLPAHIVTWVVSGQDTIASTGKMELPDRSAHGQVRMVNLSDQEIDVPAGTVVLTAAQPMVRFRTIQAISIKPGVENAAIIQIWAVSPGSEGNVAENEIQAVEGQLGTKLAVNNPEPTSGGSDRITFTPSHEDERQLHQRLLDKLQESALKDLQAQLIEGQELIPASLELVKLIEEHREPMAGLPADRLTLTLSTEFSAWVVDDKDIQQVALSALDADLPVKYLGDSGTLKVIRTSEPEIQDMIARWEVLASRKIHLDWSQEAEVQGILGGRPGEVSRRLQENLGLIKPPRMILQPAWWPRLPFLAFRIRFEVE